MSQRLQTGIPALDEMLGGGLLPGTMTVVLGATGIGKTQLGIQYAKHGQSQEGESGIVFDLTSRGDSQNHSEYAKRLGEWQLSEAAVDEPVALGEVWDREKMRRDSMHLFRDSGRRVTSSDMDADDWRRWSSERATSRIRFSARSTIGWPEISFVSTSAKTRSGSRLMPTTISSLEACCWRLRMR